MAKNVKVYQYGKYSPLPYRTLSITRCANKEKLEELRKEYVEKGWDCGEIIETPMKVKAEYFDYVWNEVIR